MVLIPGESCDIYKVGRNSVIVISIVIVIVIVFVIVIAIVIVITIVIVMVIAIVLGRVEKRKCWFFLGCFSIC